MSDDHSSLNHHPNIEGLTLFTAEPAPHEHKVHEHDAYSIIGLTHGAKQFHHTGNTVEVHANQIAIANPGELHGCGPINQQPWAHRTWYVSASLMKEIASSSGITENVLLQSPVITDTKMAERLIKAHTKVNEESDLLESQSIALEALSDLVEHFSESKPVASAELKSKVANRIATYEEWLNDNLDQSVELTNLAELVGVKRNQVIKDFKNAKGVTPGNYFRLTRLRHAKQRIREGAELVEATHESGFADQSHFSREFKAAFGITPNHYKQANLNSNDKLPL